MFTDDHEAFGVVETVELKPGGQDIAVTEENKHEYVKLVVRHRLLQGISEQVSTIFTVSSISPIVSSPCGTWRSF